MNDQKIIVEQEIKGKLTKIFNQNKHSNADFEYFHLLAEDTHYLFTHSQMEIAKERALKNKEDLIEYKPNLLERIWNWIIE